MMSQAVLDLLFRMDEKISSLEERLDELEKRLDAREDSWKHPIQTVKNMEWEAVRGVYENEPDGVDEYIETYPATANHYWEDMRCLAYDPGEIFTKYRTKFLSAIFFIDPMPYIDCQKDISECADCGIAHCPANPNFEPEEKIADTRTEAERRYDETYGRTHPDHIIGGKKE